MRQIHGIETFPTYLIDDMHKAFDKVCAKLALSTTSERRPSWWPRRSWS